MSGFSPKWLIILLIPVVAIISYFNFGKKELSYNEEIRPIFNKKCIVCHGGVKKSGNFSLLFREEALAKAKSGKYAIIPYESANSELVKRLKTHDLEARMPKEKEPLSDEEINKIVKWIDQGAKWEDHWSYIKPDKSITPPETRNNWAVNGIDNFIYEKLENEGLKPSAEADKITLLRRLYLDLIGLPPTIEETKNFQNDQSENAYEKQVDKLLKSPAFGERWASMWLDLARYADSKGYEKDLDRSIWQYRDWVINAFNNDMPFDQFTIQQIAGDYLPKNNLSTKSIENQLIATAFHRNTMANDEGGTNDEEFRNASVIDRVSTTMEVFQGTTMACVQCHSHPYDPFRHEEFYQLAAFFNNAQDRDIYNEKPILQTFSPKNEQKLNELTQFIKTKIPSQSIENQPNELLSNQREKLLRKLGYYKIEAENFDSTSRHIELLHEGKTIMQTTEGSFTMYENVDLTGISSVNYRYQSGTKNSFIEMHIDKVDGPIISKVQTHCSEETVNDAWYAWKGYTNSTGKIKPTDGVHDVFLVYRKGSIFLTDLIHLDWMELNSPKSVINNLPKYLQDSIKQLADIEAITIPIMTDRVKEKARKTNVFLRGNWMDKGQEVKADFPKTLASFTKKGTENTRLDMANWLVNENNPLTSRVIVNRFWEQLFGNGIVETLEDFGTMGAKPSHPELLDWLAVKFQFEQKWSVKQLLKLMVMSSTYRQSANLTEELKEKDPRNLLLARGPRVRLSSEQIRDQAMQVCGLLNTEMYGPSVKPPSPTDNNWRNQPTKNLYRRAIYTYWRRTNPYPSMITFDSPQRNVCTSLRIRTNTPLQALTTLNDTVYYAAAQNVANKILKSGKKNLNEKIGLANEIIFQKPLNDSKKEILTKFYSESLADFKKKKKQNAEFLSLTILANALMNTDEFLTK
jgi:Protein of unknown function (DUF1553)/Protein of unknown function (DUF1549)/Planctomycete cytochrome C/Carbohydrate binding module (family 6)